MYICHAMCLKTIFLIGLFALISFESYCQSELLKEDSYWYALRVTRKKSIKDTTLLTPEYHPNGFFVLQNGVYDFRVMGHKYFFYRVLSITPDSINICPAFDNSKRIALNLNRDIAIRILTLDDGLAGMPILIRKSEYYFDIVSQKQYCQVHESKICVDSSCSRSVSGYQYFTAGYGCWKALYKEGGKTYIIDNPNPFALANNRRLVSDGAGR
jgi:hypothetical protein